MTDVSHPTQSIADAGPHATGRIVPSGAPLATARLGVVMAHGRGGMPDDMTRLGAVLNVPDATYLALEAVGGQWWPDSFLVPLAVNEPWISSAVAAMDRAVDRLNAAGIPDQRIGVMGFSQGGCLALEYAARSGRALRFVGGLSAGLIGNGEAGGEYQADLYGNLEKTFDYSGQMNGTHVYLGCHEIDAHIPIRRVQTTARVFKRRGATVKVDIIPGTGHGIIEAEIDHLRGVMAR